MHCTEVLNISLLSCRERHAAKLTVLLNLNMSRSFEQFMAYGHQFKSLRTLELTTGDYGKAAQPLLIPFRSKWVRTGSLTCLCVVFILCRLIIVIILILI